MSSPSVQTIIIPVHDLEAAKAIYTAALGAPPVIDEPYYVHYQAGDQSIGLDPTGHSKGMTGPRVYVHVEDITATLAALTSAGATVIEEPHDVGGGRLIGAIEDADGNAIGVLQG